MKINEYNEMMAYLTRKPNILSNNINDKKIPNTEARTALKKGSSDTKPTPKNNKILKYIDDHRIVYDGKEATKTEREDAAKRIDSYKNQMSKQDEYNTYFNKKSPKYYKADKPKSNGKYTMPKFNLDSFDWDIWLRENDPYYETLQEENKKAGILEFELASEYWQQQYQNYQNTGGTLSYPQFMQQQLNNKISKNINKIADDKKKTEGLAAILGVKV
ncbi:MAG: hypothetical protein H8E55_42565 [Pelagibacterales bacterium]|nr:hypothetical protein [Pelagibacterales bacterium]